LRKRERRIQNGQTKRETSIELNKQKHEKAGKKNKI
jgi:hypothetical protein